MQVQKTAASAVQWLTNHGGQVKDSQCDLVTKLSRVATSGKWSANAERDTQRLLARLSQHLDAAIENKQVRMINPSTFEESWQPMPMILPHQFCLALWKRGEHVFRRCLFGELTEQNVQTYWDHLEAKGTWFADHPAKLWPHRGKLAGVSIYGDEVQAYRNSECGIVSVVAFTADLSFRNDPLMRYFATAVWSEHHESDSTYNDCIQHVVESFRQLSDPSVCWPWTQKGYKVCFTGVQGDLKWICDRMGGLFNYRRNDFCSRCYCTKTDRDVYKTLPYFPNNPDHFGERRYDNVDMATTYSDLFRLPLAMSRIQHDVCHSQLLGSGKTTNGHLFEILLCFITGWLFIVDVRWRLTL